MYDIEKPEKGASVLEYTLKYITIFFVALFGFWGVLIAICSSLSQNGLTPKVYIYTCIISFVLTIVFLVWLLLRLNKSVKLGSIYQIKFNDSANLLVLNMFNNFKGVDFQMTIPYNDLIIKEKQQSIEIKSELKMEIYNGNNLINKWNIAKTPWTAHPKIVDIVNELRRVSQ